MFSKNNEKIFHMKEKKINQTNKKSPSNPNKLIVICSGIKIKEIDPSF